jgi:hypothetical protein
MEKNETNNDIKTELKAESKPVPPVISETPKKSKGLPLPVVLILGCLGVLVVLGIIISLLAGYLFKKVVPSIIQNGIESKTGIKIDTKDGKESFSITDKNTGAKLDFGKSEIPENFPKDFPLYPGAKPSGSLSGGKKADNGFWLMLTTPDTLEKVDEFYSTNFKKQGWTSEELMRVGNSVTWKAGKGNLEGTVMASREKDEKETGILIILNNKKVSSNISPTLTTIPEAENNQIEP